MNFNNKEMLTLLGNTIFVISPVIGFIPQLLSRNVVFSPLLSLMLIISAIFKFYYRRVEHFSNILIYQGIVLTITQNMLVYNFKYKLGTIERRFYDMFFGGKFFSAKKRGVFMSNFMIIVSVLVTMNLMCFFTYSVSMQAFGIASVLLESSVGLMQLVMRRAEKDVLIVEGEKRRLPKELFLCWIVGDVGKLYWMYVLPSPAIFTLPVVFQIGIDFLLLLE